MLDRLVSHLLLDRRTLVRVVGGAGVGFAVCREPARAASLTDRFGIFYFFAQTCGVCKEQSPVLRAFADRTQMSVVAVSEDGGLCTEFPHYRVDTGQRARMGLAGNTTPTIALFDTATRRVVEISEGFVDGDDLARRIFAAARALSGGGA